MSKPLKPYWDFVSAIGHRESENTYTAKNRFGYLGRFQFGLARLADFGLCQRIPGTRGFGNSNFMWRSGWSEHLFLSSPTLQDKVFEIHVQQHRRYVMKHFSKHLGKCVNSIELTLSGAIACVHLLGYGGLHHFIAGENTADANGTMASDYISEFAGYEIPVLDPEPLDLRDYLGR